MGHGFPDREERAFRLKDLKESTLGKPKPQLRTEKPVGNWEKLVKGGLLHGNAFVSGSLSREMERKLKMKQELEFRSPALCSSLLKTLHPFRDRVAREYPLYL